MPVLELDSHYCELPEFQNRLMDVGRDFEISHANLLVTPPP